MGTVIISHRSHEVDLVMPGLGEYAVVLSRYYMISKDLDSQLEKEDWSIKMDNIQWIFSGIGTQILVWIVSILISGFIGYKIGISKNRGKQLQTAGDESEQEQLFAEEVSENIEKSTIRKNTVVQKQKAGNKSKQTQIGEIKRGHK